MFNFNLRVYAVKYNETDVDVENLSEREYMALSRKQKLVWSINSFEQAFNSGLISADDYCIRILEEAYRYQVVYFTQENGQIIEFEYFNEEPNDANLETYNMPAMKSKYAEVYYDKYDTGEYDELVYDIVINA